MSLCKKNVYTATLVTLLLPFAGMLNISCGFLAIVYLLSYVFLNIFTFWLVHLGYFYDVEARDLFIFNALLINSIAAIDCFLILKRSKSLVNNKSYSKWYNIILLSLLVLIAIFLFRKSTFDLIKVVGGDWPPVLYNGEYAVTSRPFYNYLKRSISNKSFDMNYYLNFVKQGDIVTFKFYEVLVLAEVVAISGDYVQIKKDNLLINNTKYNSVSRQANKELTFYLDKRWVNNIEINKEGFYVEEGCLLVCNDMHLSLIPYSQVNSKIEVFFWDSNTRKYTFRKL